MTALLLLGLMSVQAIVARGRDPLSLSVAAALRAVRQTLRGSGRRMNRGGLSGRLGQAIKDDYRRQGSKKARDWSHKKREKPPGCPKIRPATQAESRLAQEICAAA